MYKTVPIIILSFLFTCCSKHEKETYLVSPKEGYNVVEKTTLLTESNKIPDSLGNVEAYYKHNDFMFISTNKGLFVVDGKMRSKIIKYYSYLMQAYNLEIHWVKLLPNKNQSKLLVTISTGQDSKTLVFQVDIKTLNIDWTAENQISITAATYSNDSKFIVLGTSYSYKKTKEESKLYYASLFIVNSESGEFVNYYKQGNGVENVEFSDDDSKLYAVLEWPHVDIFVWDIKNTDRKVGVFGKDYTSFYDAIELDNQNFISLGADGIYKWNVSESSKYRVLYSNYINAGNTIHHVANQNYIMVDYQNGTSNPPCIKYFDRNLKLIDSVKIQNDFFNTVVTNFNISGIDRNMNSIHEFNIISKVLEKSISINKLRK